jgi:hypothetical protein
MERLFSPCNTRLDDLVESIDRLGDFRFSPGLLQVPEDSSDDDSSQDYDSIDYVSIDSSVLEYYRELNLNVSIEELLNAESSFTYADLYAMLGDEDTLLWLTPHAAVARDDGPMMEYWGSCLDESIKLSFSADGEDIVALARSPEHLLEICDVILRLLVASVVHSVILGSISSSSDTALINAPTLAYLMEQCESLRALTLRGLVLDENHCRVLGAYSKPGLEIELANCRITGAGASALAEVLRRNQGPTKLILCYIDNSLLADGLRGNSCLKSLSLRISGNFELGNREVLAIAGALRENQGLVDLNLSYTLMSDEAWDAICDSLNTHQILRTIKLRPIL